MDARKPCRECGSMTANAGRVCTACLDDQPAVHRTQTEWRWSRDMTDWKREYRVVME